MPALLPTPISLLPQATIRDPNGLVPNSVLFPYTTYSEKLADLTGCYNGFTLGTRPLNAATTAGLPTTSLGMLLSVVLTGADAYPMMLTLGAVSTNVPLSVQPADYNAVTNPVAYNLQSWHSTSKYIEGISGAGFLNYQPQVVTPFQPTGQQLRSYANGTYGLVIASASGSLTIPVSGYSPTSFLQRQGTWTESVSGKYTPGNASAWSGVPPTTIQQALDRLAAVASSKP